MSSSSSTTRILALMMGFAPRAKRARSSILVQIRKSAISYFVTMLVFKRRPTKWRRASPSSPPLVLRDSSGRKLDRRDVPDLFGVLANGAIGGKLPHPRHVVDRLLGPAMTVEVRAPYLLLGAGV